MAWARTKREQLMVCARTKKEKMVEDVGSRGEGTPSNLQTPLACPGFATQFKRYYCLEEAFPLTLLFIYLGLFRLEY